MYVATLLLVSADEFSQDALSWQGDPLQPILLAVAVAALAGAVLADAVLAGACCTREGEGRGCAFNQPMLLLRSPSLYCTPLCTADVAEWLDQRLK